MPIYKGSTEVTSGNLHKGSTEVQDGYKATDSFYVNEISISFLNFPGTASYVLTGAPGATIPGSRAVSWTATAPGGSAYNGTQTATGLPSGFAFAGGSQGSISNTTTSPNVNFISSVFPNNSTSVDYNTLTVSLPTTAVVSYSYTFTGTLGRSTSCTAFSGSACGVSSNSSTPALAFEYYTANASGTGGGGLNSCNQGCSVSISSSGGSSSCNKVSNTASQSATMAMASMPTYAVNNPTGWQSVMYCATVNSGAASSICGGYRVEMNTPPSNTWSGGYTATDGGSCPAAPSAEIGGSGLPWRLVGRDLNGTASGTWSGRVRSNLSSGGTRASDSTST